MVFLPQIFPDVFGVYFRQDPIFDRRVFVGYKSIKKLFIITGWLAKPTNQKTDDERQNKRHQNNYQQQHPGIPYRCHGLIW